MKDKTAAEKLQGYWNLELGSLPDKESDVETLNPSLQGQMTSSAILRVNVESHPRTNIIVGSTNSESGFLRGHHR
jgi:hypothetical protein